MNKIYENLVSKSLDEIASLKSIIKDLIMLGFGFGSSKYSLFGMGR
jgi:hypothetical protein